MLDFFLNQLVDFSKGHLANVYHFRALTITPLATTIALFGFQQFPFWNRQEFHNYPETTDGSRTIIVETRKWPMLLRVKLISKLELIELDAYVWLLTVACHDSN